MRAHFIDVGQANSTLLEFSCGTILIDAGDDDLHHKGAVLAYLREFFSHNPQYHDRLSGVIVTHTHVDHNLEVVTHEQPVNSHSVEHVEGIIDEFQPAHYVDTGRLSGSGKSAAQAVRSWAHAHPGTMSIFEVRDDAVRAGGSKQGLTNGDIDPIDDPDCAPRITVLAGALSSNPGWVPKDFGDENNHSLLVRVDFGKSSFLFAGDLEVPALDRITDYYTGATMLQADVLEVPHHGSDTGIKDAEDPQRPKSSAFFRAVSPVCAVVSVGKPEDNDQPDGFDTAHYGHPRVAMLNVLEQVVRSSRTSPRKVKAATAPFHFEDKELLTHTHLTSSEGTIIVEANALGDYEVTSSSP